MEKYSEDAIISLDLIGYVTSCNSAACELFGLTEDDILGRLMSTVISKKFTERFNYFLNSAAKGKSHIFRVRDSIKGAMIREFCISLFPNYDLHGRIIAISCIAGDISYVDNMRQKTNELNEIVEESPKLFISIDKEFNLLYINEKVKKEPFLTKENKIRSRLMKKIKLEKEGKCRIFEFEYYVGTQLYFITVVPFHNWVYAGVFIGIISDHKPSNYDSSNRLSELVEIVENKTTQLELSNKHLPIIIENAGLTLFATDFDGTFILFKGNGLMGKKVNPDQVIGISAMEFYKDNPQVVAALRQTLGGKETRNQLSNDKSHYNVTFFPTKVGEYVTGMTGLIVDISEIVESKKQAELAKRKLEGIERAIYNSSIVTITDPNGNIIYANESFCKLSGYSNKELVGQNHKIVNSDYHPRSFWKHMWATIKIGENWRGIVRNKSKDGSYFWVDTVITPLEDDKGMIEKYLCIGRDVTEQKNYEAALQHSEEIYRELIEDTSDLIQSIDNDGNFIYMNRAWKNKMMYSEREIESMIFWNLVTPNEREKCKIDFKHIKDHPNKQILVETEFKAKDGTIISVRGNTETSFKNGDWITRSIFHDVTEMKNNFRREKELVELRNNFVSTASHQFRTPLTVIQSNIELMDMIMMDSIQEIKDKYPKISGRINQEIRRMTNLMNNVLMLGKLNSNSMPYNPEKVDLVKLCNDINEQYYLTQSDGRRLDCSYQSEHISAYLDPNLFKQAIMNLLSNAFKFSEGRDNPKLSIKIIDKEIQLTISDNGIGIPEEDLDGLFKPFFRSNNVGDIPGSGLGMSIVKEYVEVNGGRISVESGLNKGVKVKIRIEEYL